MINIKRHLSFSLRCFTKNSVVTNYFKGRIFFPAPQVLFLVFNSRELPPTTLKKKYLMSRNWLFFPKGWLSKKTSSAKINENNKIVHEKEFGKIHVFHQLTSPIFIIFLWLTYLFPMHPFSIPLKHQKTKRFLVFLGGKGMVYWQQMG